MYQAKFIQLLAVISLTTFLTACSDKPKETEQTQPPQEQPSTEIKAEELNIATYDPQAEENAEKVGEDKLAEEINKLDAELEKVAEEIKPSKATTEVAPTKTTQATEETTKATAEVAETEPSCKKCIDR